MNNILKKVSYSIMIVTIIICSFSNSIFATSINELQNQQSDIQNKIDETNSEIDVVQSEMTAALTEISKVTNQISDCENKILELTAELTNLTNEIDEKEKNIEEQQNKYDEQKRLLDKRLVAVYQSGNTTYLDVLLSSSSLSDFISKYYLVEQITECDKNLLTQIQALKVQIEDEKTELEENKKNLEITKRSEEIQQTALENLKKEKEKMVSKLSNEEKTLQDKLDSYEADKKEIAQEITKAIEEENRRKAEEEARRAAAAAAARNSESGSYIDYNGEDIGSSSDSGFICPLAGRSKCDITTGFRGYAGHTGVDFARNSKGAVEGLPVLAAKSGTVIISKALKNSSGGYRSYGEYIVINHGDGTLSLYAHMQPGSRRVEVGDYVSQGEQIGNVGTTGNSTGYHLHFEVRLSSGAIVNPTQYLP